MDIKRVCLLHKRILIVPTDPVDYVPKERHGNGSRVTFHSRPIHGVLLGQVLLGLCKRSSCHNTWTEERTTRCLVSKQEAFQQGDQAQVELPARDLDSVKDGRM